MVFNNVVDVLLILIWHNNVEKADFSAVVMSEDISAFEMLMLAICISVPAGEYTPVSNVSSEFIDGMDMSADVNDTSAGFTVVWKYDNTPLNNVIADADAISITIDIMIHDTIFFIFSFFLFI